MGQDARPDKYKPVGQSKYLERTFKVMKINIAIPQSLENDLGEVPLFKCEICLKRIAK